MGLFTSLVTLTIKDFIRKFKRWIISVSVVLAVLFTVNYFFEKYTGEIVGPLIKEMVLEKSNGLYRADFKKMGIALNSGRFWVNDFSVTIDSAIFLENQAGPNPVNMVLSTHVPRLYIHVSELWAIYLKRELHVVGIESVHPQISLLKLRSGKKDTVEVKKEIDLTDLYALISDYLTVFELRNFILQEGGFKFSSLDAAQYSNYEIKNISIEIKNFLIDEHASTDKTKFFYTDNVKIEIRDQSFFLSDSLHEISFDRLLISTMTKSLEIDNLILEEKPRINADFAPKTKLNRMYFVVPSLRMHGIDFFKAYNHQSLYVDKVMTESPVIKFVSAPGPKNNEKKPKNRNGNDLLQGIINNITIDTLVIDNANLDITLRDLKSSSHAVVENFSLTVNKLQVDTAASPGHSSRITYEDLAMSIRNSKFHFADQLHDLEIGSINADSNPLNIELTELNFRELHSAHKISEKRMGERNSNTAMELSFPQINITGFSLSEFLNKRSLKLSDIRLNRPEVYLCTREKAKGTQKKPMDLTKLSDPYSLIKKTLRSVNIDNVILEQGRVQIDKCTGKTSPAITADNLNIHFAGIEIDSSTAGRKDLLGTGNIFIGMGLLEYRIPGKNQQLQAANVAFNSSNGTFSSSDFGLFSGNPDTGQMKSKPDVQIGDVKLTGIDLQQFFKTGMVLLDTLSIGSVDLNMSVNAGEKRKNKTGTRAKNDTGILKKLQLNKFLIRSGYADINQDGKTVFKTGNFNFGLDNLEFIPGQAGNHVIDIKHLDLNLDEYFVFLKKINHKLTGDHIGLDSDSKTALLTNLRLSPLQKTADGNVYDIDIPAIRITGINVAQILFDSTLICSGILISEPRILLEMKAGKGKQKKAPKAKTNKNTLPHPMKIIRAGDIKLVNGYVKYHSARGDTSRTIEVQNLNFTLNDLDIDSSGIFSKEKLLYARNIDLLADYITSYEPEKQKFISLNHLNFSTKDHLLEGSGLYFSTNTGKVTEERNKFKIDLDGFSITDLDILEILNDRHIDIGDITLTRPRVVLEKRKKENKPKKTKKEGQEFTYPLDSTAIGYVKINSLAIENGRAKMTTLDTDERSGQVYAGDINLSVEDLSLTPGKHQTLSTKSFAKSFYLNVGNLLYDLPDGLNRILAGGISLNSADTTLVVSDFELLPKVGKYEYGPAKGFQTDWVHMTNKELTVNNLHVNKLLFENKFVAPSVAVDGLKIFLFRDKRVPFVNKYKPLPQEQLQKMAMGLRLDSIIISDANVVYQEFAEKSKVPGEIYITDLNGRVLNITNDAAVLSDQPKMFLEATGAFAGNGAVNLQAVFDLVDSNHVFYLGAIIANLDLREFNRMLSPTVFVQIKSGFDKNLIMTAKANNDYAFGEMRFYYNDLRIAVLNKKTDTPKGLGNALASFFANSFFINSNNPRLLKVRKGEVFFERNKYKSIFNYWIKTFLSGIVTSIGAKSNKKQIEKIQDAQRKKYDPISTPE